MGDPISGHVRFHAALEPLLVPITDIRPHEANPNNGNIEAIVESIQENGYVSPIIAERRTGRIIAGNHRYHALLELGSEKAAVIWVDMNDYEGKKYLLADNQIAALAVRDPALVLALLRDLARVGEIRGSGYTEYDISFLEALEASRLEQADFASWPTLSLRVPPYLKNAFYEMTENATADHERLEAILRLAGWKGETLYTDPTDYED